MKQKHIFNRNRAFTLIEIMAAVAIFSMVIVTMVTIFNHASKTFRQAEATVEKFIAARTVLDMMAREIKGAIIDDSRGVGKEIRFYGYIRANDDIYFVAPVENSGQEYLCDVGYAIDDQGTTDPTDDVLDRYLHKFDDEGKFQDPAKGVGFWTGGSFNPLGINARRLKILYWDKDTKVWDDPNAPLSDRAKNEWSTDPGDTLSNLNDDNKLPWAVKIEITVGNSKDMDDTRTFSTVVILENAIGQI